MEVVSVTVVDAEVDLATAEGFETTVTRRAVTATAAEAAGQTATDFLVQFSAASPNISSNLDFCKFFCFIALQTTVIHMYIFHSIKRAGY